MKKTGLLLLFFYAFLAGRAQKPKATLNHIAVYVQHLGTSTKFYQHIIGFDTIPEPFHDGKHVWFTLGNKSQLHLIEGATGRTQQVKNAHLCFSVSNLQQLIKTLNKSGIAYEDWNGRKKEITTRPDGVKQIYFQDPDGYWIEINDDYR